MARRDQDEMVDEPSLESHAGDVHSRIGDALVKLSMCVRSIGYYGRSHHLFAETLEATHQAFTELLSIRPSVVVVLADSHVILEKFPIEDKSGCLTSVATALQERDVAELELIAGVTREELADFAEVLSLQPAELGLRGGVSTELRRRNVSHIWARTGSERSEPEEKTNAGLVHEEALLLVQRTFAAVGSGLQIPALEVRKGVSDLLDNLIRDESALLALAAIRSYDRYLSEHSVNVCILSMVFGRAVGLDNAVALELGISALLHDVGKVFLPGELLKKPGRLGEDEWEQVRRHPIEGARVLAGLPNLPALAATIAYEHHVRADGSGYPSMPARHTPHVLSRLVALADVYDALTTDRPYRKRFTPQQAVAYMLYDSYGHHDAPLMARFASRIGLYPIGSLVRLKNGEYAVVTAGNHRDPAKPTVTVVAGQDGQQIERKTVDLSTSSDPGLEIDSVAQPVEALLPYTETLLAA